jgi:tetratricopeptide (TPR) repeat protein
MVRVLAALMALVLSAFSAFADKRIALVIGNSRYTVQKLLTNPGRDAVLIANILRARNFTLVKGGALLDLDLPNLNDALESFAMMARDADVAFVYYSGHGMQVGGYNYLFPVDSPLLSKYNVSTRFVNANLIINQFNNANSKLNILLLDACRNNPFEKGEQGGLAPMQAAYGTIIGFATQPGNFAQDGTGGNSPYAIALAKAMQTPGLELFEVLRQTAIEVADSTGREQQPWWSASPVKGRFYFTPPVNVTSVSATPPSVSSSIAAVVPPSQTTPVQPTVVATVNPVQGSIGTSISLVQLGYQQLSEKKYLEARDTLAKAVELDPTSATAQTYLGFSWLFIGRAEPNPHVRLAMFREQGFPHLDIAAKNDLVTGAPFRHRAEMIMETAKALLSTRQRIYDILDDAILNLKKAVEREPDAKPGYNREALARAYRLRGDTYNPQVDPDRAKTGKYVLNANKAKESYQLALDAYNSLLAFNPKFAAGYDGRCYINMRLGNFDAAKPDAIEARKRSDDFGPMQCLKLLTPWMQLASR